MVCLVVNNLYASKLTMIVLLFLLIPMFELYNCAFWQFVEILTNVAYAIPNNSISNISVDPPGIPGWEYLP